MLRNNTSFKYYNEMFSIVNPLIATGRLEYFGFCRIYPNNRFFNLSTDYRWPECHYIENQLPPAGLLDYDRLKDGIQLPAFENDSKFGWPSGTINLVRQKFNVNAPLFKTKRFKQCIEIFALSIKDPNAYELYMNNIDSIDKLILFVKDKASNIIKKAENDLIIYTNSDHKERNKELKKQTDIYLSNPLLHSDMLNFKTYEIIYKDKSYLLKTKQFKILHYSAFGYCNNSIAFELNLSPKTIEDYISKLIQLFNISHKKQLIQIYWNHLNKYAH